MAAVIRLVCFIKTRNHVITVQNLTFQSVNCEYNALFCFAFSKLYKQKFCVILPGSYIYFPCCTSSYINYVLPYRIYACSSKLRSSVSSLRLAYKFNVFTTTNPRNSSIIKFVRQT